MGIRVQHRVGVQAPATQVWDIVADLESWKDWNPLFTEARGKVAIGSPLTLTRALHGQPVDEVSAKVVDWVPDSQLVWARKVAPFVHGLAYVELEVLAEDGCVLSIGEIFQGMGADWFPRKARRRLQNGFQAMTEAVKARAEAAWAKAPADYKAKAKSASSAMLAADRFAAKPKPDATGKVKHKPVWAVAAPAEPVKIPALNPPPPARAATPAPKPAAKKPAPKAAPTKPAPPAKKPAAVKPVAKTPSDKPSKAAAKAAPASKAAPRRKPGSKAPSEGA